MLIVDDEMFALCFLSSASMVLWLNDAAFDIDMLLFPPLRAASAPLILLVCLLFCCVLKLVPPASRPPSALPFFWAAVFDWCWKEERVGPVDLSVSGQQWKDMDHDMSLSVLRFL